MHFSPLFLHDPSEFRAKIGAFFALSPQCEAVTGNFRKDLQHFSKQMPVLRWEGWLIKDVGCSHFS